MYKNFYKSLFQCICDGFMPRQKDGICIRAIFVRHITVESCKLVPMDLDFDQTVITNHLLSDQGVTDAFWPDKFNGTTLEITEREGTSLWRLTLKDIKRVDKDIFVADINKDIPDYTYVLVYNLDPKDPKTKHCVYSQAVGKVSGKSSEYKIVECINSDPKDRYPKIELDRNDLIFFQVSCRTRGSTITVPKRYRSTSTSLTSSPVLHRKLSLSFSLPSLPKVFQHTPGMSKQISNPESEQDIEYLPDIQRKKGGTIQVKNEA